MKTVLPDLPAVPSLTGKTLSDMAFRGIFCFRGMGKNGLIAGFVEFSLAFFFSTGIGLLPLESSILLLVFAVAIPEFGYLDAVGHFTIIAILGAVCLAGPSRLHFALRPKFGNAIASDAAATVAFSLACLSYFSARMTLSIILSTR